MKENKKQNKAASSTTQTCKLSAYMHYMESLRQADQWWVQSYIIHRTKQRIQRNREMSKIINQSIRLWWDYNHKLTALGYDRRLSLSRNKQITMHTWQQLMKTGHLHSRLVCSRALSWVWREAAQEAGGLGLACPLWALATSSQRVASRRGSWVCTAIELLHY